MRTVISRGSAGRGLLSAAVVASLVLGAAGCGGDGDDDGLPDDYEVVAGTRLCGGGAISAEASKALKTITGSSRFEASAEKYSVANAAEALVMEFPAPTVTEDVCRVYSPLKAPEFELRITWNLADGPPTGAPAPEFTVLKMGERAVAAADKAYVFFACRSDKLLASSEVGHIVVGVERDGMPKPPEGNVKALKDAYATVAHSVALAMAKELGCQGNGGLPAQPVLPA